MQRSLASHLRIGAAVVILAGLAVSAVVMLPPYFRNLEFQRYLEQLVRETDIQVETPELVRARILNKAAEMGLPVRSGAVDVERAGGRYRIRVLYVKTVDLPFYTVTLHFRSATGD
jgi:hypothetical protein